MECIVLNSSFVGKILWGVDEGVHTIAGLSPKMASTGERPVLSSGLFMAATFKARDVNEVRGNALWNLES